MKFKVGDYQQVKSVMSYAIEDHAGWEVLGDFYDIQYQTEYSNDGRQRHVERRTHMFLIGLPKEGGEVATLVEQRDVARKEWHSATNLANRTKSELDALTKKHEQAAMDHKYQIDYVNKALAESDSKVEPLRASLRKLEQDLAKVQKAIGSIEYGKIVGGA